MEKIEGLKGKSFCTKLKKAVEPVGENIPGAVILLLLGIMAGPASAATWTVDDSGGANFTRIQDAIDNASNRDTILVYSGMYYENVDVNKQLILRGNDSVEGVPIVDAGGKESAIKLSADGITLIGFKATNTTIIQFPTFNNICAGIKVNSNNNIIMNNTVLNNELGIYLESSNNNSIISNDVSTNGAGMYLSSSSNNTLISNNALTNGEGIELISSSNNNTLINNTASSNGIGISLYSSSNNNILRGNIADSNSDIGGIFISGSNNNLLSGNKVSNNRYGTIGSGIALGGSDNNILINNTASNNGIGIELGGFNNNNQLSNNNALDNGIGIELKESSNKNILSNNNISNNLNGIFLVDSSRNNILNGNTVSSNNESGIYLEYLSDDNILSSNNILNNLYGIWLVVSSNNIIYNNNFNNIENARDDASNTWNITKTAGTNIIGGPYLGGNYWSDYAGKDTDRDGLGDTLLPYNSSGNITNGGDFVPLTTSPTPTTGSISGYKINDTSGNGKWDAGENGISNWTIRLIGIIGKGNDTRVIRKETFTDATGFYSFDNLPAGRYFVIEKLKNGFVPTSSPMKRIKLVQDENSMNNNFTNRPVNSQDKIDGQSDVDDYEAINRNIDKNKEDMDWD